MEDNETDEGGKQELLNVVVRMKWSNVGTKWSPEGPTIAQAYLGSCVATPRSTGRILINLTPHL